MSSTLRIAASCAVLLAALHAPAASPGIPFTESFDNTDLRDATADSAHWNTTLGLLQTGETAPLSSPFASPGTGTLGSHTDVSQGLAVGDLNNDGLPDIVIGVLGQPNRLYLHNGTSDPYSAAPIDISSDAHRTKDILLADVNRDGFLDVVAVNGNLGASGQRNRLYLNGGHGTLFSGVSGSDISTDAHDSVEGVIADFNGDGWPDLAVANLPEVVLGENRVYLNNGSSTPFSGVSGIVLGGADLDNYSIDAGDIDNDGDPDIVVGVGISTDSGGTAYNQVYVNSQSGTSWAAYNVGGTLSDSQQTEAVKLGDLNGDGLLDLYCGNFPSYNQYYLNVGGSFATSATINPNFEFEATLGVELVDVNQDGRLDVLVGNGLGDANELFLNNGSATTPLNSSASVNFGNTSADTYDIGITDLDGDGLPDIVWANAGAADTWELNDGTPSAPVADTRLLASRGQSLQVNVSGPVTEVTLTTNETVPAHTRIQHFLSNDGGAHWFLAYPGTALSFPTTGSDVRWRVELSSLSPANTPTIQSLSIGGGESGSLQLVVVSPHGTPSPAAGSNSFAAGSSIDASMSGSPDTVGDTRYTVTGWTGTGDVPASGSGDTVPTFSLDQNSSLTWLWNTSVLVRATADIGGSVSPSNSWVVVGDLVSVTATPEPGYSFTGWTGEVPAGQENDNPMQWNADLPRTITASFALPTAELVVTSPYGSPTPGTGNNSYATGTSIEASMSGHPQTEGTTRYNLLGWVGTGNVPASGTGDTVPTFNLDGNSTLNWLWNTSVLIQATADIGGSVSASNTWAVLDDPVSLTALPAPGYDFDRWTGDVSGAERRRNPLEFTADATRSVIATFVATAATLTVTSPHGTPTPPVGINVYDFGTSIDASMPGSPITDGAYRYTLTGWTGTGDVPVSGSGNTIPTFTLDTNSTLNWLWTTSVLVNATANVGGSVSPASQWVPIGDSATVTATPDPYYEIASLELDGIAQPISNPFSFTVTGSHTVAVTFDAIRTSTCVPVWWLASYGLTGDTWEAVAAENEDGDLHSNGEEYWLQTDPTKADSALLVGLTPATTPGNIRVTWEAQPGVLYDLLRLEAPGGTPIVVEADIQGNGPITRTLPSGLSPIYRVRVSVPSCD